MANKSKISISSNSKEVVETFDNAFKYVESNKSPSTLHDNYYNLKNSMYKIRKSLKKKDKPVNLSISYEGKHISFDLKLNSFDFIDSKKYTPLYFNSNEVYSLNTFNDLELIDGIDRYLGILGGGTQVLSHLEYLRKNGNNSINNVDLYDINQNQLVYGATQLYRLDKLGWAGFGSLTPAFHLNTKDPTIFESLKNFELNDVHINLNFGSIKDAIVTADKAGKYFIYTSNAYELILNSKLENKNISCRNDNAWNSMDLTKKEILNPIVKKPKIMNGSYYMVTTPSYWKTIIMEKVGKSMLLYSFCDDDGNSNERCVHPSLYLRK